MHNNIYTLTCIKNAYTTIHSHHQPTHGNITTTVTNTVQMQQADGLLENWK